MAVMEGEGIVAMEYNLEDIGTKPIMELGVHNSGFHEHFIEMIHCFGYQSSKGPNLQLLDHNTAIIAAGSFAVLLNIKTKEQRHLQTVCGGSVGHINVHPNHSFFAVAEKGKNPPIAIFDFPSLNIFKILTGGTSKSYAFVDFSPEGDLLASIGGEPDYLLTIWQWKKESILLRTKAYSQDVYRVTFSPFLQGQLTTSGMGHIKFWKMAQTFTGLKLHGEVGRFGKAEISDIHGYIELPDGKVISGSESGLLLLWDGALIKAQIRQKNGKPCHNGIIYQVLLEEGELYTIGSDGWIKVWDFESIDAADPEEEAGFLELSAMNELLVENKADLRHIVKSLDSSDDCIWYAQDGGGALWHLDMSFGLTMKTPFRIFEYPGGSVTGCMMSPSSHLLAVSDTKGIVRIYDTLSREMFLKRCFENGTTCLLWLPLSVDHEGASFLVGFEDGVVRWLAVAPDQSKEKLQIKLVQASKPHSSCLSCLSINSTGTMLATGSYDHTIFFFLISSQKFSPLGFVHIGSPAIHLVWIQSSWKEESNDIVTSEHLSLEQECQLAQKIQYQKQLEVQRQTIQQKMVTLKQNFNKLLQKDENSPVYFRVEKQKYAVDPKIREALKLERDRNKECVKMQFTWEKEKQAIALQKLEKWFRDPIEWELVTLKGFLSKEELSTFRMTYLPKQLRQEIEKFKMRDFLMETDTKNLESEIIGSSQNLAEKGSISSVKRTSSDSRSRSVSIKHKLDDRLVRAAQKLDIKQQRKITRQAKILLFFVMALAMQSAVGLSTDNFTDNFM
ncbi:cilia- and flagella-associated protein 44-like [Limulus polyphemus]|uniref:Cilia- and flagella-associated protein 44-like n=1 Tax=Limulus polyphemus TaxID=6850 RepID=A0ABM1S7Z5_LIMPO|nr:cilia- and flagella-associated protein 44-like [Limulus polyphemus]